MAQNSKKSKKKEKMKPLLKKTPMKERRRNRKIRMKAVEQADKERMLKTLKERN